VDQAQTALQSNMGKAVITVLVQVAEDETSPASKEEPDLKSGWKNQIASLSEDFQECWRVIVQARCQAGEVRSTAEVQAYCDVSKLWEEWQKSHQQCGFYSVMRN